DRFFVIRAVIGEAGADVRVVHGGGDCVLPVVVVARDSGDVGLAEAGAVDAAQPERRGRAVAGGSILDRVQPLGAGASARCAGGNAGGGGADTVGDPAGG